MQVLSAQQAQARPEQPVRELQAPVLPEQPVREPEPRELDLMALDPAQLDLRLRSEDPRKHLCPEKIGR